MVRGNNRRRNSRHQGEDNGYRFWPAQISEQDRRACAAKPAESDGHIQLSAGASTVHQHRATPQALTTTPLLLRLWRAFCVRPLTPRTACLSRTLTPRFGDIPSRVGTDSAFFRPPSQACPVEPVRSAPQRKQRDPPTRRQPGDQPPFEPRQTVDPDEAQDLQEPSHGVQLDPLCSFSRLPLAYSSIHRLHSSTAVGARRAFLSLSSSVSPRKRIVSHRAIVWHLDPRLGVRPSSPTTKASPFRTATACFPWIGTRGRRRPRTWLCGTTHACSPVKCSTPPRSARTGSSSFGAGVRTALDQSVLASGNRRAHSPPAMDLSPASRTKEADPR